MFGHVRCHDCELAFSTGRRSAGHTEARGRPATAWPELAVEVKEKEDGEE